MGAKRAPLLVSSDGLLVVGSKTSRCSKREVERLRWVENAHRCLFCGMGCCGELENLPLLKTGSREVAEGAKGPLVLVS